MSAPQRLRMLIDGEWCDASDGATFVTRNPMTGAVWAEASEATEKDVQRAVAAARRAFTDGPWRRLAPSQRGRCLRRLAELLVEAADAIGEVEARDTGKLLAETRWQARYIAEFYEFYAGCADKIHGDTLPIDKPDMFVFTRREPLGVVAAVVPWNSQMFLAAIKLGPALAAGNTVVLKVSEHAPATLLRFAELFDAAGLPPGVVNIVTGHGEPCGRVLTSHPDVARVAFTGGPEAARHIVRNSAENFASVSLELGGKSPVVVFDDANLESAVNGAVGAIFGASGQSCVAGSRLYLQAGIADTFLERMTAVAASIRLGDPLDAATEMGPLCTTAQIENIEREVGAAVAEGAELLCGGHRLTDRPGNFYPPTILRCPRQDIGIVDHELFGPVLCALSFEDETQAIALANASRHGLAAGIFTRDGARALRVAEALEAGIVWINTYRAVSPIAEAGGMKFSGQGRESGFQAMYDYTRPKTVWFRTAEAPLSGQFVAR